MILEKQPTYLPVGDVEALFEDLSVFILRCFKRSSRKDQLIEVVRESIATDIWYPCLQDLDSCQWSDWTRFAALELLVAAVGLENDVLGYSFLLPSALQLKHWFHRLNT